MPAAAAMHAKTTKTKIKDIHGVWQRIVRQFGVLEQESTSEEGGEEGGVMGGSTIRSFQGGMADHDEQGELRVSRVIVEALVERKLSTRRWVSPVL
jgi:hypothetical protein